MVEHDNVADKSLEVNETARVMRKILPNEVHVVVDFGLTGDDIGKMLIHAR